MQRTGTILLALFVGTFGVYFVRFLFELDGGVQAPPADALKGTASAAQLDLQIGRAIADAERVGTLGEDQRRLLTYLIFPPAGVLLSLITCIGLYIFKRRFPAPALSRFLRRSATVLCVVSLLSILLPAVAFFHGPGFQSLPFLELCSNSNTEPPVVVPGARVKVHVDYSPLVKSIQQRHQFESVSVSNLTFKSANGESGGFGLTAPPRDGRRSGNYLDDTPAEWSGLSRLYPTMALDDLNVFLDLPNEPRLQSSLVNGDVQGDVQYPYWAELDRVGVRSTPVSGHITLWVASSRQANFAAMAERFRRWRTDDTLLNNFLWSLILCVGLCAGTGKIASAMKTNRRPAVQVLS
jgi:hypothetical protein